MPTHRSHAWQTLRGRSFKVLLMHMPLGAQTHARMHTCMQGLTHTSNKLSVYYWVCSEWKESLKPWLCHHLSVLDVDSYFYGLGIFHNCHNKMKLFQVSLMNKCWVGQSQGEPRLEIKECTQVDSVLTARWPDTGLLRVTPPVHLQPGHAYGLPESERQPQPMVWEYNQ